MLDYLSMFQVGMSSCITSTRKQHAASFHLKCPLFIDYGLITHVSVSKQLNMATSTYMIEKLRKNEKSMFYNGTYY